VPGDVDVVDDIRSVLATLARLDLLDLRADA